MAQIFNRGGSNVNFERIPILNYLKLRPEAEVPVYTAPEHFMNLACWYLKQGQAPGKALKAVENAVESADRLAEKDPAVHLVAQCKARVLLCAILSPQNRHDEAFESVYEANRFLDLFWEYEQDTVLNHSFWREFGKVKYQVLRCLCVEAEFLRLPDDVLTSLQTQRDRFFQENGHDLVPADPIDAEEYAQIKAEVESLSPGGSPEEKQLALLPLMTGAAGSRSASASPRMSGRHSSGGDPAIPRLSSAKNRGQVSQAELNLSGEQIYHRAEDKLKKLTGTTAARATVGVVSVGSSAGSTSPASPPQTKDVKVQGLYPGRRVPEEDLDHIMRGWQRKKSTSSSAKSSKRMKSDPGNHGALGPSPRMADAFLDFKNNAARQDADTENPKVRAWQLASGVRRDYKRWTLDSKKKHLVTVIEERLLGEEVCYQDRVYYSKEGLASMKRRKQVPGSRRRDLKVQQDLSKVTGQKLGVKELQWTLQHLHRLVEFNGLETDINRRKALAAMRSKNADLDLGTLRAEMTKAEDMYHKFAKFSQKSHAAELSDSSESGADAVVVPGAPPDHPPGPSVSSYAM
ncbi:unnamed protein product [Amoebophrya sp. A120]|nr:unnamed protein product [Amoebophrya sp. A120]|eukprot:GSA120T00023028001.1